MKKHTLLLFFVYSESEAKESKPGGKEIGPTGQLGEMQHYLVVSNSEVKVFMSVTFYV